ncbi:decarboxylating 6-phosphogluconate dehydrogenase [Candidatus Woesearchaeota archaeon]|nr:decarboxylating 6-phosphogluconate dehydrogenase [Candidatus Woesearchaeota archaeon]
MATQTTEVGLVGLGRMGLNMVSRLLHGKKTRVVAFDLLADAVKQAVLKGVIGAPSAEKLVGMLKQKRRVVWLMLPSGEITESTFQKMLTLLKQNDILIDGGNSNFHDTIRRHKEAKAKGIHMLDVGVSGGVVAAERGYAMMAGGSKEAFIFCKPLFDAMCQMGGCAHISKEGGSGHYVKMVHNAIEYGMMQSIAEGFDLLHKGRFKNLELEKIAHLWNHGTIVTSFLMEMTENALKKSPTLDYFEPYVEDNGEGRWASIEAMEHQVPFVSNTYALHARYLSRDKDSLAFKMLAAMRNEFGGHAIKTSAKKR